MSLADLLEIIRTIEGLNFESSEHIMLAAADVIALHLLYSWIVGRRRFSDLWIITPT